MDEDIVKPENWKKENSKRYTATFYHSGTNGTLCFAVTVENYVHRISLLYIKNLEKLYHLNLTDIVDRCSIK
ncbi:MAG: hypothetical protein LBF83_09070 [Spirochaetaceae bacterium]|nr:hypothetical protein [Spirochaetaceae bacterium]